MCAIVTAMEAILSEYFLHAGRQVKKYSSTGAKGGFNTMRELTAQDFERAVRNPHFDKLMTKVEVAVTKEDWATFCEIAKINDVPPEVIMQNGLEDWAKELREDD